MARLVLSAARLRLLAPAAARRPATRRPSASCARRWPRPGRVAGAYVLDLETRQPLYAEDADVARIPASVEKLYTTATALLRFGPEGSLAHDRAAPTAPRTRPASSPATSTCAAAATRASTPRRPGRLADAADRRDRPHRGQRARDRRRVGLRRPARAALRRASGPRARSGPLSALTFNRGLTGRRRPVLPGQPGAVRRRRRSSTALRAPRRARCRAARAPASRRRRWSAGRSWASPTVSRARRRTNVPVGQLHRRDAAEGARRPVRRRAAARRRARGWCARRSPSSACARASSTARGSRAPTARRRATSCRLLTAMDASEPAPFAASLAVAGRTGTLRRPDARHGGARRLPRQDRHAAPTSPRSPATARPATAAGSRSRS